MLHKDRKFYLKIFHCVYIILRPTVYIFIHIQYICICIETLIHDANYINSNIIYRFETLSEGGGA